MKYLIKYIRGTTSNREGAIIKLYWKGNILLLKFLSKVKNYLQELEAIRMEVGDTGEWSDDDNYPEGFDPSLLTSSPLMSSSKSKHRKLNTNSISVSPPHSPGAAESTISTLVSHKSNYLNNTTNNHQKSDVKITEEMYRSLLSKHKAKQSSESVRFSEYYTEREPKVQNFWLQK